ncbi:MAG: hypothetical protein KKF68_03525 [Nanoarchaeota archaeon]|nr:hypothetical protein [Nanoarchaeota archaeon]
MKGENLIHIKLEYNEAVKSKKEVLQSEINLLKIAQVIKRYNFLRAEELRLKEKLHKKLKEAITNIKKLQTVLPKIKIPSILREEDIETKKVKEKHIILEKEYYDGSVESQLREIQNKLNSLQT